MRKAFDLRPLAFNDVLGRSFSLYTSNFILLLRWFAIFWLVPMLATAVLFYFALDPYDWVMHRHLDKPSLVEPNRYAAYHWLLSVAAVLFGFTTGAAGVYFVAARAYVGENLGFGDLIRAVQKRFAHVAGVGFLHVLVIVAWTLFCWASPFVLWEADEEGMAVLVGFLLWCGWLPMLLWYLGTWGLNTAVPLLDDAEATEAYGRSRYLTRGFRMRLAGVFMAVTLVVGAPGIPGLLTVPGIIATSMAGDQGYPLIGIVAGLAWDAVLLPMFFIPIVVYYFDMRCRKESYDLAVMALNFGIDEQELARYRFNPGLGYFPRGWKGDKSRRRAHVRMPAQRAPQQRQAQLGVPTAQWGAAQPLPGQWVPPQPQQAPPNPFAQAQGGQWGPPPQIPSSQWGPPPQGGAQAPRLPNRRGPTRP